jgi:hypothetical protein
MYRQGKILGICSYNSPQLQQMMLWVFFLGLAVSKEECVVSHGSSVDSRDGFLRIKNLAVVRSSLELVNPENDYKPCGSKKDG